MKTWGDCSITCRKMSCKIQPMRTESLLGVLPGKTAEVHDAQVVTTISHRGRAFVRQGK